MGIVYIILRQLQNKVEGTPFGQQQHEGWLGKYLSKTGPKEGAENVENAVGDPFFKSKDLKS